MHSRNRISPVYARVTINVSRVLLIEYKYFAIYFGYYSNILQRLTKFKSETYQ